MYWTIIIYKRFIFRLFSEIQNEYVTHGSIKQWPPLLLALVDIVVTSEHTSLVSHAFPVLHLFYLHSWFLSCLLFSLKAEKKHFSDSLNKIKLTRRAKILKLRHPNCFCVILFEVNVKEKGLLMRFGWGQGVQKLGGKIVHSFILKNTQKYHH